MSKRFFSVVLLCLCSSILVGCNEVIDLSDEESALIAEYAAEMLLKYDLNYVDRIVEGDKQAEEISAKEESTELVPISTQESTEAITTEGDVAKPDTASTEKEVTEAPVGSESDIAKIAGVSGISITYKDYLFTNQYPKDSEYGSDIDLEAQEGHQLLVLRFEAKNLTEETVTLSMLDKMIDYRIVCNGTRTASSMLTILPQDLSTMEETLNPGKSQEAVLIFQISDSVKNELESIALMIQYNDMNNMIQIL